MNHDNIVNRSNQLLLEFQKDPVFRAQVKQGLYGTELRNRYINVLYSYPGLLFEESFLRGDVTLWREALKFDGALVVQPTRTVCLFNGFDKGYKIKYKSNADVLAWKQWRDASLRWDEYTHARFPSFPLMRRTNNLLYTNFSLPKEVVLEDIVYETNRGEIMPGSSAYMYEYELSSSR